MVEPIRNKNDLKRIEKVLKQQSLRNLPMLTIGTNCGLRISDILSLDVGDVKGKKYICLTEKKTGKQKRVVIENKYKDRDRKNKNEPKQLEKYENYINLHYQTFDKGFIYLRPFQHELDEKYKNWKTMTYKDILDILYTLKADDEYLRRYKKIIEKIYETQTICILALKEILGFSDNAIIVDNVRGDINGYAVEIHLGGKYGSFLEVAHENPIYKNEKIEICLTVKKENKTQSDDELFEILNNNQNKKENNENYEYITEKICSIKDYSPELIKEKFENSKIVKLLKQKNVFSASNDDMVV